MNEARGSEHTLRMVVVWNFLASAQADGKRSVCASKARCVT